MPSFFLQDLLNRYATLKTANDGLAMTLEVAEQGNEATRNHLNGFRKECSNEVSPFVHLLVREIGADLRTFLIYSR